MKKLFIPAIFAAGLLSSGSALAEGMSANLDIEAKVTSSCTLNFDTPKISFNIARDNFSGLEQVGYFTAKCGNHAVKVALDGGQSGDVTKRAMKADGSEGVIGYQVYQKASGQEVWGMTADTDFYKVPTADSQSGKQQAFRVVIPSESVTLQTPEGTYTDHLMATISYDVEPPQS